MAYTIEDASWENDYYLDLETGQVAMVRDETRRELESIYEETYDPEIEKAFDLAQVLEERDIPEWYQQELLETDRVEQEYLSRYIRLSSEDPHQGYRDMEAFIVTVRDERLQDRLWKAIRGRGAFRRFKDTLARHPREEKRWFEFKDKLMRQRVLDWLASENIEPITEPRPAQDPLPSIRPRLIEEVLIFVRAASQLRGVTRIALIGSLTTDEANMASLATLGRKLNGHVQSLGRGRRSFFGPIHGATIWAGPVPGRSVGQAFGQVVTRCTVDNSPTCTTIWAQSS